MRQLAPILLALANVSPATYPLVAFLDDGGAVHELPAGSITVPP